MKHVDADLFGRLKRRGWSLENRSALLLIPPTLIVAAAVTLGVHWVDPSIPDIVTFLIIVAVALVGSEVQRRFLTRHDDDPESGLRRMGDVLGQDETRDEGQD